VRYCPGNKAELEIFKKVNGEWKSRIVTFYLKKVGHKYQPWRIFKNGKEAPLRLGWSYYHCGTYEESPKHQDKFKPLPTILKQIIYDQVQTGVKGSIVMSPEALVRAANSNLTHLVFDLDLGCITQEHLKLLDEIKR